MQDLIPDRNLDYESPLCEKLEEPLSFGVDLKTSAVKQTVDESRVNPSHREHASRKVDIVSSRMPGFGKVVLYRVEEAGVRQ